MTNVVILNMLTVLALISVAGMLTGTILAGSMSMTAFAVEEPGASVYKTLDENSEGWFVADGRGGIIEYHSPVIGYYLKEVNGEVIAKHKENFLFEPASAIKALYHFHVMKQIESGAVINGQTVTQSADIPYPSTSDCPKNENLIDVPLGVVLTLMMKKSDNPATLAVQNYFGLQNIYQTEYDLGMSQTTVVHTIGCGGPPQNTMTLVEAGKLYEGVSTGYLSDREKAFSFMSSPDLDPPVWVQDLDFNSITHSDVFADFKSKRSSAAKAGGYDYGGGIYRTIAGWASIPFKDPACNIVNKEYVYGAFIHDAYRVEDTFDIWKIPSQLLVLETQSAIQTWKRCEIDAIVVAQRVAGPNPAVGLVGQDLKFDVHVGVEADGVGVIPGATVLTKATPIGNGLKVNVPSLQTWIYDLQDNQHHSLNHAFTVTCNAAGSQYVKFKSTVNPYSELLPMIDLNSSNNSKELTIKIECVKLAIFR